MKVSDLMTKEVMTVSPDSSVRDAAKKLYERKISGLPVINEKNEVVGMLTEKDILNLVLPSYSRSFNTVSFLPSEDPFHKHMEISADKKVKDIMRKNVNCVDQDVSALEAVLVMLKQNVRRLPVVSGKKLVGIISRHDVVREILKLSKVVGGND
jgi:CBS domain-containing protein